VLIPVDESRHVFHPCRGRGYVAAATASNWNCGWDWVTINIDNNPTSTDGHNNHTQQSNRVKERGGERTSQGGGGSGDEGGGLR